MQGASGNAAAMSKTFRLTLHQRKDKDDEVLIARQDYPGLEEGDVIEVRAHDGSNNRRLLVQITNFNERPGSTVGGTRDKPTLSLEESLGKQFHLTNFCDVIITKIDKRHVTVDSVEVTFRDQYLSRADMWRLKRFLNERCVHVDKVIEFNNMRVTVYEMWSQGDRVASGYIEEDTKVVFRSNSAQINLFIQMSSEMWEFDIHGDLYFEKAVDGFLTDLFNKWRELKCTHDVTIVLFSRTFYDANSIEEFPERVRDCLQQDYQGRFYEDYYRIAVQNERYEDWTPPLLLLKRLFNQYQDEVINRIANEFGAENVPRAYNSTASQGNFLEVLNTSLNVFEKHYMYRSFDRTGQLSVIVSPGVGVCEVDFELTNITKQRIIDNGIGSDLVCLGEQPLHAVPLFRFRSKNTSDSMAPQFNMPHWINLSFYSSNKKLPYSNFVPRIRLPPTLNSGSGLMADNHNSPNKMPTPTRHPSYNSKLYRSPSRVPPEIKSQKPALPTFVDYDEHDAQIFKMPSQNSRYNANSSSITVPMGRRRPSVLSPTDPLSPASNSGRRSSEFSIEHIDQTFNHSSSFRSTGAMDIPNSNAHAKEHDSGNQIGSQALSTSMENKPSREHRIRPAAQDDLAVHGYQWGNGRCSLPTDSKPLINPFNPSQLTIKLTSNRRRWTHVFPQGPTGIFMQQHHYQALPQNNSSTMIPFKLVLTSLTGSGEGDGGNELKKLTSSQQRHLEHPWINGGIGTNESSRRISSSTMGHGKGVQPGGRTYSGAGSEAKTTMEYPKDKGILSNETERWAWGATGELKWTPALTTGVDWKSLAIPACLPLTTDFFPEVRNLQNNYLMSSYTLLPEAQITDFQGKRCYRAEEDRKTHEPLSTEDVFDELICQRLQQGFQIILLPHSNDENNSGHNNRRPLDRCRKLKYSTYHLSIGRIFHGLQLDTTGQGQITIIQYRPRHPNPTKKINYCYRFRGTDNETYGVSWVDFTSEKLENYNWNFLDNYICHRGENDREYELRDSSKHWRFRLFLLPAVRGNLLKKIYESGTSNYDVYDEITREEKQMCIDSFIKFMEIVNRVKKPQSVNRRRTGGPANPVPVPGEMGRGNRRHASGKHGAESSARNVKGARAKPSISDETDGAMVSLMSTTMPAEDGHLALSVAPGLEVFSPGDSNQELPFQEGKDATVNPADFDAVINALKTSNINFLNTDIRHQSGLPPWTFISGEAVQWAMKSIDTISTEDQAINMFQSIIDDGNKNPPANKQRIRHASGEKSVRFKYGFILFSITNTEKNGNNNHNSSSGNSGDDLVDMEMFKNEWLEVEVSRTNSANMTSNIHFMLMHHDHNDFKFKKSKLDYDNYMTRSIVGVTTPSNVAGPNDLEERRARKLRRAEWVHIKYHSLYDPDQAFEMIVEWMAATGNSIPELTQGWIRKLQTTALHLVPLPSDPFALPTSSKSDPLRGPIFVPLNMEAIHSVINFDDERQERFSNSVLSQQSSGSLTGNSDINMGPKLNSLGEEIDSKQTDIEKRVLRIQERILMRFGFIPFHDVNADIQRQFMHVCGGVFLMIPNMNRHSQIFSNTFKRFKLVKESDPLCSPHEEYITRHFTGTRPTTSETQIGFLWAWNYMLTKRWRTTITGDEKIHRQLMDDFCRFVSNDQNRLVDFLRQPKS